ncbi:MAG TPA: hypothetical protein VF682_05690 [Pseudomonas sp.]
MIANLVHDAFAAQGGQLGQDPCFAVRMPESLHTFIETLANDLESSKQEIMLKLLEQGAEAAQTALDEAEKVELAQLALAEDAEPQPAAGFHILNTNKAHTDDDHEWMLAHKAAAAF